MIEHSFDKVNRQTVREYQDSTRVTQVYVAVGNRTLLHDHTGRYTTTYDDLSRPQVVQNATSKTIMHTYDKVSQRATMAVPGSGKVTYTHEKHQRGLTPLMFPPEGTG